MTICTFLTGLITAPGRPIPASGATIQAGLCTNSAQYSPGRGRIANKVEIKAFPSNTPAAGRVVLHRHTDGKPVAETWSDATTGSYAFENIDEKQKYYVVAFDHTGSCRAVIADNLTPEVI